MAGIVLPKNIVIVRDEPVSPNKPKVSDFKKTRFQMMRDIRLGFVSKENLIRAINDALKLALPLSASKAEIDAPLKKLKADLDSSISKTRIDVIEKEDSKAYSLLVKLKANLGKINTFLIQLESLT